MSEVMNRRKASIARGREIAAELDKLHLSGEVYDAECTPEFAALRVLFRDGKFRTLRFKWDAPESAENVAKAVHKAIIAWK